MVAAELDQRGYPRVFVDGCDMSGDDMIIDIGFVAGRSGKSGRVMEVLTCTGHDKDGPRWETVFVDLWYSLVRYYR